MLWERVSRALIASILKNMHCSPPSSTSQRFVKRDFPIIYPCWLLPVTFMSPVFLFHHHPRDQSELSIPKVWCFVVVFVCLFPTQTFSSTRHQGGTPQTIFQARWSTVLKGQTPFSAFCPSVCIQCASPSWFIDLQLKTKACGDGKLSFSFLCHSHQLMGQSFWMFCSHFAISLHRRNWLSEK